MSLTDVMAIPEKDGWEYTGLEPRDGEAFVCSGFAAGVYKAAGLLVSPVNANEFTPRDIYNLNIFDKDFKRPQACIDADPDLPDCQLVGDYRIDISHDYSLIEPYANMNEKCPSINPNYERPDGC